MKVHDLDCSNWEVDAIIKGNRTADLRKNDREFHVGDILRIHTTPSQCKDDAPFTYKERIVYVVVTHVFDASSIIGDAAKGFVVMSISRDGVQEGLADDAQRMIEEKLRGGE